MIQTKYINEETPYTGVELISHWIFNNFDIPGNAIVGFTGPCDVSINNMVDLLDVKNNDKIYSPRMLHFIAEFFDHNLEMMVHRQRLFIHALKEELEEQAIPGRLFRDGDDLYHIGIAGVKRKLTVSIATRSPVSVLMHTGINILTQGTPVPTSGLGELGIEPVSFAHKVMDRFKKEMESIKQACYKVKAVD
ncbi:MAG: DUF366 family protein [Vulcanimicrobiota bacterium]